MSKLAAYRKTRKVYLREHRLKRRKIFKAYLFGGKSMAAIGREFDLSSARVWQIVERGRRGLL